MGLKRKGAERKVEQRMVMEDMEEGSVALLELSDRVMEQVKTIAKKLGNINRGIWALVAKVKKLMEVVEGLGRKEVEKADKEIKTKEVQKVDK
jgi:hypothetical protein